MENKKREIAKFYEQIFSDAKLKEKLEEKAKTIVNDEDLKNLIQQEIIPLMKKYNVNFSEKELLEYEKETLKKLSEKDLDNVSGGVSIKSALLTGGILSMALLGGVGLNSSIADASKNPPEGPPNNKPGTTQQKSQKRKSASKFKPTTKKVKEQSDNDDDDDTRPSQRSEATESAADKTKKEKHYQSIGDFLADYNNWKETDVLEFIEKNPAESIDEEKVQDLFNKLENFFSIKRNYLSKEGRPKIMAYLKKIEPQNNSSDNDNDDDDKRTYTGKPSNLAILIEDLERQKGLYESAVKYGILPTSLDGGYVEYMNLSNLRKFLRKLKVGGKYQFYNYDEGNIENKDMLNLIEFYKNCCEDSYVPKKLFSRKGHDCSGLIKAVIFGNPYSIDAAFKEGKINYNYTDVIEIFDNVPYDEIVKYPKFLHDAIDEFREKVTELNNFKIKILEYESKLDNGEESIDKAALQLGKFYKEFLELTKNDYEQYLRDKEELDEIKSLQQSFSGFSDDMYEYYNKYLKSMIEYDKGRDSKRIEELIKGELDYDSVLVRKFDLLNEKTRDAVIKDTEYIASKIKKSGNIPFLEGRLTNYTIDANCLEIISGFDQNMPYLLGKVNRHLTYTPCTKGIMGESLNTVAPRLIEFLGNCVSRFQANDEDAYAEEVVWEAVNKDNCFKKVLESLQPTGKKLDASKFLRDDEKEAFKKAKEDIDYLHQYMKPNSDGTWTLKVNMLSRGSKIDGLGMIDYFYNNPELFEE